MPSIASLSVSTNSASRPVDDEHEEIANSTITNNNRIMSSSNNNPSTSSSEAPAVDADEYQKAVSKCKPAKEKYDRCFNAWYRHSFLQGNMNNACEEYFDEYQACLMQQLKLHSMDDMRILVGGKGDSTNISGTGKSEKENAANSSAANAQQEIKVTRSDIMNDKIPEAEKKSGWRSWFGGS